MHRTMSSRCIVFEMHSKSRHGRVAVRIKGLTFDERLAWAERLWRGRDSRSRRTLFLLRPLVDSELPFIAPFGNKVGAKTRNGLRIVSIGLITVVVVDGTFPVQSILCSSFTRAAGSSMHSSQEVCS